METEVQGAAVEKQITLKCLWDYIISTISVETSVCGQEQYASAAGKVYLR